jgi:hypothetical protein
LVRIRANRGTRNYVEIGEGSVLYWTASDVAQAEIFEELFTGTDQVKLRAQSTGLFVRLDQTDETDFLVADTTEALAAVINIPLCAATNALASNCTPNCRAFEVTNDNSSKFVTADDQGVAVGGKLRARGSDCGGSASAWESWEFIDVP